MSFEELFNDIYCRKGIAYYDSNLDKGISCKKFRQNVYSLSHQLFNEIGFTSKWIGLKYLSSSKWFSVFWGLTLAGYSVILLDNNATKGETEDLYREIDIGYVLEEHIDGYDITNNVTVLNINKLDFCGESFELPQTKILANRIALCTSGTTGKKKIAVYTSGNCYDQLEYLKKLCLTSPILKNKLIDDNKQINFSGNLPFHHCFAFFLSLFLWKIGGTQVFVNQKNIDALTTIYELKNYKVSVFFTLPKFWELIDNLIKNEKYNEKKIKEALTKSIKLTFIGGTGISSNLLKVIEDAGIIAINGYGTTETGIVFANTSSKKSDRTNGAIANLSCGLSVIPQIKFDANSGGELLIPFSKCCSYFIKAKKKFIPNLWENNFFETGDICKIENNFIFITGRKTNIITSGGENVSTVELEKIIAQAISKIPFCVINVKNTPVAVIPETNKKNTTEFVQLLLKENRKLPFFKKIKTVIVLIESLPVTSTGKVKTSSVKNMITLKTNIAETYSLVGRKSSREKT